MDDQDDICLCFKVSVQKVRKFIRLNKPVRESQISECYGAGTGCGWCRPFLKSLYQAETSAGELEAETLDQISPQDYALRRQEYRVKAKSKQDDNNTDGQPPI